MKILKWFYGLKLEQKLSDFTGGVSNPVLCSNTTVLLVVGNSKEYCAFQEGNNIEEWSHDLLFHNNIHMS